MSRRDAERFDGTAGRPRDLNYHQPRDDLDNVDPEALTRMTDAITHAATTLAEVGWGIHHDAASRVALVTRDSKQHRTLADNPSLEQLKAMRSKRM